MTVLATLGLCSTDVASLPNHHRVFLVLSEQHQQQQSVRAPAAAGVREPMAVPFPAAPQWLSVFVVFQDP